MPHFVAETSTAALDGDVPAPSVVPLRASERVWSVDVLRGVAVLGILLMNIVGMGLPHWAYDDPTIAGNRAPSDFWAWAINSVLFEGKMRAIFSMLFGAGVILITSRAEARRARESIADIHLRRNLWLIVFGAIHAYLLLWPGDILYTYGVAGLPLFVFRRVRPRNLIAMGAALLALQVPRVALQSANLFEASAGLAKLDRIAASGGTLSAEQKKSQAEWRETIKGEKPGEDQLAREIENRRTGYVQNLRALAPVNAELESSYTYSVGLWDAMGMMLIGMGLLKLGVFSAARSYRFYAVMALCGYGYGVPTGIWIVHDWVRHGFDAGSRWVVLYDSTRLAGALGHVALVMVICKAGVMIALTRRLAAVGRMALTNYVTHTVICGLVFGGFGLGFFGRLSRHELYYVVFAIWAFQLTASPIWLRHFQFGPLEWAWRSLTYRERQPMAARSLALAGNGPVELR